MFNCLLWISFQNSCLAWRSSGSAKNTISLFSNLGKLLNYFKKKDFWGAMVSQVLCHPWFGPCDPSRCFAPGIPFETLVAFGAPGVLRLYHARVQAVYMWPYLNLWFYRRERESKQTLNVAVRRWTINWAKMNHELKPWHPIHLLITSFLPSQHIFPFCRRRSLCLMRVVQ